MKKPLTVIGAGSWGTALAIQAARNNHPTRLWGVGDYVGDMAKMRCNLKYLPDIVFPTDLEVFTDLKKSLLDVDDVLIVVPSHAFREVLQQIAPHLSPKARIVWGTKGLDPDRNLLLHEVVEEVFDHHMPMAVLAGPSFALEVAKGLPTALTLASNDPIFAQDILQFFHSSNFRIYLQDDMVGVEISGAVKNGLAVATGISDGLNLGANARAALITRGLAEMMRLGTVMGGRTETFMGLAGLGDLILTCTDNLSRNRRFGIFVGQGMPIDEAERAVGQVVEGKSNAIKVFELAKKYKVEMPIIEHVCLVIHGQLTPQQAVQSLLSREPKHEIPSF